MIAQDKGHAQLRQWLEDLAQPVAEAQKRERSSMSRLERAQLAGVADMLKPIPHGLHMRIASGSEEDAAAAKKEGASQAAKVQQPSDLVCRGKEAERRPLCLSF